MKAGKWMFGQTESALGGVPNEYPASKTNRVEKSRGHLSDHSVYIG